ncbi:MAG: hypothetical protein R2707_16295 [Acidimicrobiales bacterium]
MASDRRTWAPLVAVLTGVVTVALVAVALLDQHRSEPAISEQAERVVAEIESPSTTSTTTTTTTSTTSTTTSTTTTTIPPCCGEGHVGFLAHGNPAFTPLFETGEWEWMEENYDGLIVYKNYWNRHVGKVSGEFVYKDLMALYVDPARDTRPADHPDWVLREADGTPVYIDWGCSGGCPQYAAYIAHPDYQIDFIASVQGLVDLGYTGLMLDDVNLRWTFSDRFGGDAAPIDPRTGALLTLEDWQRDVADFVERIRATFPDLRIMHNVVWFSDTPEQTNASVDRQIAAADMLQLERGGTDPNFMAGSGRFGLQTFLRYIERADALGTDVVLLDEGSASLDLQIFNLAVALLVNSGGDLVSTENVSLVRPYEMWSGFDTDLGDALGGWYESDGVLRRDFTGGIVLLNEPTRPTVTVDLDVAMVTRRGERVTSVTLPGFRAAVLSYE